MQCRNEQLVANSETMVSQVFTFEYKSLLVCGIWLLCCIH